MAPRSGLERFLKMVNQRTGAGGYGACWSLTTDQRTGPFYPHSGPFFKYINHPFIKVKCLSCGSEWIDPINHYGANMPKECVKELTITDQGGLTTDQ